MERQELVCELEKKAKETERIFPQIKVGAVCTGIFLVKRNYHRIGNDGFFKREINRKYYTFFAIEKTRDLAISYSPIHPFYQLAHIC